MELIPTVWSVFGALLVFVLGTFLSLTIPARFGIGNKKGFALYLWHTLWCLVYLSYVLDAGGDSLMYFRRATSEVLPSFGVGTVAVIHFTRILSEFLGLSILGAFLINNIIGFIGLLGFAGALNTATLMKGRQLRLLAHVILLLPSVSFWTSAIGKDSLAFMSTGLALWAALHLQRRVLLMSFAILVVFFVRPHIACMMLVALSANFVFRAKVSSFQRFFFGIMSLVVAASIIPFAFQYAGFGGNLNVDALSSYFEARQGYNQQGGGGVDIAAMSLPMQLFTYMLRPLVFEARSIFQMAAAVDNLILIFLFVAGGLAILKGGKSPVNDARVFLWVYALLAWAVLAMTTANLGIAVRQKWMFAPMLIYLMISLMGQPRNSMQSSRISTSNFNASELTHSKSARNDIGNL